MNIAKQPFWLVGFRPFFTLACLAGLSLPLLWVAIFDGSVSGPHTSFTSMQWHAHEMFFGFGWAVMGGFLLTSTKNWVKTRGFHGWSLIFLAAAWLIERLGMWFAGDLPSVVFGFTNNLYLVSIIVMLVWTLVSRREHDSFPDNYFFLIMLPAFLVAKNLMISSEYFHLGVAMSIGLFRLAFLVMLERTLTQFMKGVFQVAILRHPILDRAIKMLALPLVLAPLLPPALAAATYLLLAVLLLGRFIFWKPQLAMRRLDLGIMYLGYLAIAAQLLLEFHAIAFDARWVGTVSVHVFTLGAMGLVIPAMLIRICKGHTGRKVAFDTLDKWLLRIMIVGFVVRIVVPQFFPGTYMLCLQVAALCWLACFAVLGWRYIPFLLRPRIDGKEH